GSDGGVVAGADAGARAVGVVAGVDRVLIAVPGRRRSPGELALLAAPGRGVLPLGLARQEAAVPDAKGVGLVPVHAADGQVLVVARRVRPGGSGGVVGSAVE